MKDIKFVNADQIETLEQYGAALLSSMISLRTLYAFHTAAFNKGILNEDEAETGKTICWEIQRLTALYKTQMEHVLDRTEINEKMILKGLNGMMSEIKIPKKRKNAKKVIEAL